MAEITKDTKVRALTAMLDSINAQAAREQDLGGWLCDWAKHMIDLTSQIEALLNADAKDSEQQSRNWTEDAGHENGNYQNRCSQCGNDFIGHKRRMVCRACDANGS